MTLDEAWQDVVAHLARATADPASAFRNLAVASVDRQGRPHIRTVVLRQVEPASRWLQFHTDARSAKVVQFGANPAVALHGWDPSSQVQIRLDGNADLHRGDAAAAQAWAGLHAGTRRTYRVQAAPGTPVETPGSIPHDAPDRDAFAQFVLATVRLDSIEWLCLRPPEHRRARFTWRDGAEHATWLVP